MTANIVITRHEALVLYLKEKGIIAEDVNVIKHAYKDTLLNKHVIGVLPHSLSRYAKSYTEIPLALPVELRGKELTIDEVRKYAGDPVTYSVKVIG